MTVAFVECHSGHTYAERPLAFLWDGERIKIEEIIAEWQTPEGKHFRVRTAHEQIFELVYEFAGDVWKVLPFR